MEWIFRWILRVQDSQEEPPAVSRWDFLANRHHGVLRSLQGLLNAETACRFTCPRTHLSWILLLNQFWTLPPRVEDPLKHGLTISSTLFQVMFQWLVSIQNRCFPFPLRPSSLQLPLFKCPVLLSAYLYPPYPSSPNPSPIWSGETSLRDVPFSDSWFSSSASGVWDLPEAAKGRHRGSLLFTPVTAWALLLFSVWYTGILLQKSFLLSILTVPESQGVVLLTGLLGIRYSTGVLAQVKNTL